MACGVPAEESWPPRASQARPLAASEPRFLGDVTPDVRNWLRALRFTVDDYDERFCKKEEREEAREESLQKGLSDSDLSSHSFDFIDLDHLNLNKHFADSENLNDPKADDVCTNVFDDILCNIGNEIFQLDSYHKKYFRQARGSDSSEFEHSVMHVFDDFLEEVRSSTPLLDDVSLNSDSQKEHGNMELKVPLINKVPSYSNISALSDEVFLRSGSSSRNASNSNINTAEKETDDVEIRSVSKSEQFKHASFDINRIFDKGGGAPVPPKRKNRLSIPTLKERTEMINKQTPVPRERTEIAAKPVPKPRNITKVDQLRARFDSDTEITRGLCQKAVNAHPARDGSDSGNNSPASDYSDYQNLWLCTSGRQKQVISSAAESFKENFGVVNTIRYDSLKDISNPSPDLSKQRIVLCGPHTRASHKSGSSSSNKSDRTESEGVESGVKAGADSDGKKRYSEVRGRDERKTREKPPRAQRGDMVSCTSECDATDECHRAISRHGGPSEDARVKRDVISVNTNRESNNFVRVFESATVPRARELKTFGNIRARDLPKTTMPYDCASDCADSGSVCGTDYLNNTATEDDWESSVEIISDSDSYRTGRTTHGRRTASDSTDYASESPIYENLREIVRLKPVPDDVIAWKALLMDPYWIEDEEDEWISSEESFKYSQDRLPSAPTIIPRVRSCRSPPRMRQERPEELQPPSVRDTTRMFEQSGLLQGSPKGRYKGMLGPNDALPTRVLPPVTGFREVELRAKDNQARFLQEQRSKSMLTTPRRAEKQLIAPPKGEIFKEGLMEWTKFLDNGKKMRKNWQTNFAVLKRSTLEFYPKDTTHNSKQRPSPEFTFLFDASVVAEATSQQTKQNHAYVLTSKRDQIILRHKDRDEADEWYIWLRKIINNQASDYHCPDSSSTGSPSPSPKQKHSKSKTPNKDVEKSDLQDSKNEPKENYVKRDLENCIDTIDPQDIQYAPMKKRIFTLQSLIKKRKSKEEITSKGIYKDEAVFGCSLQQVCEKDKSPVPEFVKRCIGVIEAKDEHMNADGLYRASGNLSQVQKIRMEVDKNNFAVLDKPDVDVHVLAGALKLFFRELKEPVIPCWLFQRALDATSIQDYNARVMEFKDIVRSLPDCNRQTLKYLLEHLLRVTEREDKNRMQINNLSIVLGPTLLWPPNEMMNLISIGCLQQNLVIEIMLTEFKTLFSNKNDYETPL